MAATYSRLPGHLNRAGHNWDNITDSDTPASAKIEGGKYGVIATGTFAKTVEIQWSPDDVTYISIDPVNLLFSAAGAYNFEMPAGYIKPVMAGSGTTDIDLWVNPLPSVSAG